MNNKRLWLVVGATILVAGVAVAGWFLFVRETGPIPRKYTQGLDFALYYPSKLPDGYSVDPNSFHREGEVLIFSVSAPNNRSVAVSQQALPSTAPPRKTVNTPFKQPDVSDFTTSIGSARISLWGDKYVSDVIAGDTWIIMNVTNFTGDEATVLTQSFRKL